MASKGNPSTALMISKRVVLAVIITVAFAPACSPPPEKQANQQQSPPVDIDSIKNDIKQLDDRLTATHKQLYERLQETTGRVVQLESEINHYKEARFDPTGEHGFQRVDANIGTFLVVLDNVQPYLDGQKITLLIGNPNYVIFNGLTLNVSWGPREPEWGKIANDADELGKASKAYAEGQHNKEIKLTDTLRPATWNKVRITIAPAKAEQFGQLGISIMTNQVVMGTK